MATTTPPARSSSGLLERRFRLTERKTDVRTEALGGLTTFATMAYIVFVNPAILSAAGMPFGAVAVATALAAAIFSIVMGLYANVPFALASGLGINAIVAFDIVLGHKVPWQVGMACVVVEGLLAVVLVLAGLREAVVRAVPMALKLAIGVGGVFDQLAGVQRVPPAFLHRVGLEWLWRLLLDPSRWRRQRVLPLFAVLVLRKRLLGR